MIVARDQDHDKQKLKSLLKWGWAFAQQASAAGSSEGVGADPMQQLFPEERALCQAPGEQIAGIRMNNLVLGRIAAHRALEELCGASAAVSSDGDGVPLWPSGVVGSISHSGNLAAAAVAKVDAIQGVGIDIELQERKTKDDLLERIAVGGERSWAAKSPQSRLQLFCAKEAAFKALFPIFRESIGFRDVEIGEPSADVFPLTLKTENLRKRFGTSKIVGFFFEREKILGACVVVFSV